MSLRLSTGLRTALAGTAGFGATFANGIIEVYSGTQPATADAAATGTLLGRITLASGAFTPGVSTNGLTFASAAAGAISKTGIWSMLGIASGAAGWFRLKGNATDDSSTTSTTAPRLDGSVAVSGADMAMSNITIVSGTPVTVDTFTWTVPAA